MLIGYARVSTDDQSLSLQKDALLEAGCGRIFEDRLSGAKVERPGLSEALKYARAGLRAARARGRQGGRPKALDRDRRDLAVKLYEEKQ